MLMKSKNQHRVALALGYFAAVVHLIWILMVAGNVAQPFLNWVLGLHMVANPVMVGQFQWGNAIMLLIMTFIVGYLAGWIFVGIYDWVCKKR